MRSTIAPGRGRTGDAADRGRAAHDVLQGLPSWDIRPQPIARAAQGAQQRVTGCGWTSGSPPGAATGTSTPAPVRFVPGIGQARQAQVRASFAQYERAGADPDQGLPGSPLCTHCVAPPGADGGRTSPARTSAPPATRSTAPTSYCRPPRPSPARRSSPSRRGRRSRGCGPSPWRAATPKARPSPSSSTPASPSPAHADEREAHLREVERFGQEPARRLLRPLQPPGHRRPRDPGAARLRAVEQAYRMANERDIVFGPPEPTTACRYPEHAADNREIELE